MHLCSCTLEDKRFSSSLTTANIVNKPCLTYLKSYRRAMIIFQSFKMSQLLIQCIISHSARSHRLSIYFPGRENTSQVSWMQSWSSGSSVKQTNCCSEKNSMQRKSPANLKSIRISMERTIHRNYAFYRSILNTNYKSIFQYENISNASIINNNTTNATGG